MSQRSKRLPALSSPLTLLDQVAPAHHAITSAMAGVAISGAHYQALARASEALHRLAADLGYPRRLAETAPSTVPPASRS